MRAPGLVGKDQAEDRRVTQRFGIFEGTVHRLEPTSQVRGQRE